MTQRMLVAALCALGGAWVLLRVRAGYEAERLVVRQRLTGTPAAPEEDRSLGVQHLRRVAGPLARNLRSLTPAGHRRRLEALVDRAGLTHRLHSDDVLVLQGLGALAGGGLAALSVAVHLLDGRLAPFGVAAGVVAGLTAPVALLQRAGDRRIEEIRRRVPDLLDLLALSVGAGMGFDAALAAVASRIHGPLAEEVDQVLTAVSLGQPRELALDDLGTRLGIDEVADFVVAVNHASSIGASIGPALERLARSARVRRRQLEQERVNRLPVKLLIPTTLFILPATLVVVIGPAMSDIMAMFS